MRRAERKFLCKRKLDRERRRENKRKKKKKRRERNKWTKERKEQTIQYRKVE